MTNTIWRKTKEEEEEGSPKDLRKPLEKIRKIKGNLANF